MIASGFALLNVLSLAGQNLLQPSQLLSVHPCWVMMPLDSDLWHRPLERQASPLLQHHVVASVSFVPGAKHGCWFVSSSPHVL